jgi:hypothetical protein
VPRRLDRLADRGDVVDDARGRVDVGDEYGLDRAGLVRPQTLLELGRPHRAAPISGQHLHLDAELCGSFAPAERKPAAFEHQHLVPARQHVGQRGFPCAVPVGDVDVTAPGGGKQPAQVAQEAVGDRQQRAGIDVDDGAMHRPQHFVRHRRRPGDGHEFAPGSDNHRVRPFPAATARMPRRSTEQAQSLRAGLAALPFGAFNAKIKPLRSQGAEAARRFRKRWTAATTAAPRRRRAPGMIPVSRQGRSGW